MAYDPVKIKFEDGIVSHGTETNSRSIFFLRLKMNSNIFEKKASYRLIGAHQFYNKLATQVMSRLKLVISINNLPYIYIKLTTIVEGNPKDHFSIATTPRCRGGCSTLSLIRTL